MSRRGRAPSAGGSEQRLCDSSPPVSRIHSDRIQLRAAPGGACDAVSGHSPAEAGDQEQLGRFAPAFEECFRRPGIAPERPALDFEHTFEMAPLESANIDHATSD